MTDLGGNARECNACNGSGRSSDVICPEPCDVCFGKGWIESNPDHEDSDDVDGCGAVLGVLFMGFCLGWLTGWLLTCRAYERAALDAGHAEIVDGRFEWLPVGDVAGGGK